MQAGRRVSDARRKSTAWNLATIQSAGRQRAQKCPSRSVVYSRTYLIDGACTTVHAKLKRREKKEEKEREKEKKKEQEKKRKRLEEKIEKGKLTQLVCLHILYTIYYGLLFHQLAGLVWYRVLTGHLRVPHSLATCIRKHHGPTSQE